MDKKSLKNYRNKLLARREEILGLVSESNRSSRDRDLEITQDPADMAANHYAKELSVSMTDNDRRLLSLINEALARIEANDYGECVHCGEPVSPKRLDAIPWARHCVRCQELQERGLLNEED